MNNIERISGIVIAMLTALIMFINGVSITAIMLGFVGLVFGTYLIFNEVLMYD